MTKIIDACMLIRSKMASLSAVNIIATVDKPLHGEKSVNLFHFFNRSKNAFSCRLFLNNCKFSVNFSRRVPKLVFTTREPPARLSTRSHLYLPTPVQRRIIFFQLLVISRKQVSEANG